MSAPHTALRNAGAQHAKAMLLAIHAENEATCRVTGDLATPDCLALIIESHVAAATGSESPESRSGFFAALAEWVDPTTDHCLVSDPLAEWQPLAASS